MASKNDKERDRLREEFEQIQREDMGFDFSMHLATSEDIPDLGTIELYDYDADLTVASENSMNILESLVDLYLEDVPKLKNHPYIKNKMREDAMVYAETIFLSKMTRRNFLTQLKQVDNGDNSARMHEIINQTVNQIRENAKFSSNQRRDLEKFYINLRKDLGLADIDATNQSKSTEVESTEEPDGVVIDNRNLNDLIKNAMLQNNENKKK